MDDEILKSNNGVKAILDKLDDHFIPDKLQHRIDVWDTFWDIKRQEDTCIRDHIKTFFDAFQDFKQLSVDIQLDINDSILALILLKSCNLVGEDRKIVRGQMEDPPSTKNLIGILKRVLSKEKKQNTTH